MLVEVCKSQKDLYIMKWLKKELLNNCEYSVYVHKYFCNIYAVAKEINLSYQKQAL